VFGGHGSEGRMDSQEVDSFPPEVTRRLKTYVYRLIDPRNGESFYIGKGRGDRVFAHIRGEQKLEGDELDNRLKRIRDIRLAGFDVGHVIHRHGMDDKTAFEVEAALMDAYPGLTNVAGGRYSDDYGARHARQIVRQYSAEPARFRHRALLISVNVSAEETSVYEATRYAWKINPGKARQAEVVLATRQGEIIGAFIAEKWLEATAANSQGESPCLAASASSAGRPTTPSRGSTFTSGCLMNTANPAPQIPSSTPGRKRRAAEQADAADEARSTSELRS